VNYIFENIAIAIGFAYSSVIVFPVQAITLAIIAKMYFKEKITPRKIISMLLCVIGVMLIGWKGGSLSDLLSSNLTTLLFVCSAIGASLHIVAQKRLISSMDSANMNFSIFLVCTLITAVPVPFHMPAIASLSPSVIFALVALGFITGISFYLNALVLKKVPLFVSAIITNCSVLFALLWAWLFLNEPITMPIIAGAVISILGILLLSIPSTKNTAEVNHEKSKSY
jgi:drug/metabolite transporter (DMT)-like permease